MSDKIVRYTILKRVDNKVITSHHDSLTYDQLEKHKRDIILDNISGEARVGSEYLKQHNEAEYREYLKITGLKDGSYSKFVFHFEKQNPSLFNNHIPIHLSVVEEMMTAMEKQSEKRYR